jgi:pyruvate dehydrogenase (quinone)
MPGLEQARAVQIDRSGEMIGLRYPYEVNLVADAKVALKALIPLLERKSDRSWREKTELNITRWWEVVEAEALVDSDEPDKVNPMRVVWELNGHLPANAIVASDSGSAANWYARHLKMKGDVRGSLSGNLATMGPGVPYGIGAKFGHPDRPVIVFAGDGAMQMNGLAELITISKYWREWSDPRLVVCVLHNNDLNQVTWEMRAMEGSPKFTESQGLPDISYSGFANSVGLLGIDVGKAEHMSGAWAEALGADRPAVIDVRTDPNFPPIPPHATTEQMKDMIKALVAGDEDAWQIIREGVKTKVQEFLPHSKERS